MDRRRHGIPRLEKVIYAALTGNLLIGIAKLSAACRRPSPSSDRRRAIRVAVLVVRSRQKHPLRSGELAHKQGLVDIIWRH